MPSIFTYHGNQTNQRLANYFLPSFPIRWCAHQSRWVIDGDNLETFLIKSIIIKQFSLLWLVIVDIHCFKYYNVHLTIGHVFNCSLLFCLCFSSIIGDFVALKYGKELVGCCNWSCKTENLCLCCSIDSHLLQVYAQDFPSKLSRLKSDPVGLIVNVFVFGTYFTALTCTILFVSLDYDLLQIMLTLLFEVYLPKYSFIEYVKKWNISLFGKVFRWLFCIKIIPMFIANLCVLTLIVFTMVPSMMGIQKVLLSHNLCDSTLSLYRQLTVTNNVLLDNEKAIIFICFSLGGYFIAACAVTIDIGLVIKNSDMIFSGFAIGILLIGILAVTLHRLCCLYEFSVKIIMKWTEEAGKRLNKRYWTIVVLSNRPLSIPAGYMGIVDTEMQLNYFGAILVNTVNLLLTINEVLF